MKRSLLTGFRALAFAISAFALLALTGSIEVRRSADVAIFIVGLTAFWVLAEKILPSFGRKRPKVPEA